MNVNQLTQPAAFGRLCVETGLLAAVVIGALPAAFGRLCVETRRHGVIGDVRQAQPPSGGCVLKPAWCR